MDGPLGMQGVSELEGDKGQQGEDGILLGLEDRPLGDKGTFGWVGFPGLQGPKGQKGSVGTLGGKKS